MSSTRHNGTEWTIATLGVIYKEDVLFVLRIWGRFFLRDNRNWLIGNKQRHVGTIFLHSEYTVLLTSMPTLLATHLNIWHLCLQILLLQNQQNIKTISTRAFERGNFSHLLLSFSLERHKVPFRIGFVPFYVSPPPFPRLIASASLTMFC